MTRKVLLGVAAALALMLLIPEEASAQYYRPAPRRFGHRHRPHAYVGGQLMGMAIANQATDVEYMGHGGGGGLFAGFRLSPFFAIEGNWMITYHNEAWDDGNGALVVDINAFYIMSFTADAKIFIPTFGPMEPYFQAGIGFAYTGATYGGGWSGEEATVWASGPTFNVGGGLDFYLGPRLSLGGRLLYRGFYFSEPNGGGDTNYVSGVSLDINVAFHF
jgi:hypothetical protein